MDAEKKVVIDAGHGGDYDPGAVFEGRKEKDDNLRLALAVGRILAEHGVDVLFTRVTDVYDSPAQKAQIANEAEADYFISIHRNAALEPGRGSGTMTLVYEDSGEAGELAAAINRELENKTGFANLGVLERPDLIVLRRTQMPAVLVEAGFIDNPVDNERFDREFLAIAEAIAGGILEILRKGEEASYFYMVQTGVYRIRSLAEQQLAELHSQGYPAYMIYEDGYFKVMAGAFKVMDHAVQLERELRSKGFPTMLVYRHEVV